MIEFITVIWFWFMGTDAACVSQCQHEGSAFGYVEAPSTCYCVAEGEDKR
jgi:hypothetical protein